MTATACSTTGATIRTIAKVFTAHTQKEGAGFLVNRPFPGRVISDADSDPFLLLDELGPMDADRKSFPGAPWHPHRGFDTVTYLKKGEGAHQDSMGNKGVVRAGEVQWMSAASGIIHDEGREHPGGELHGFQMWVNLPALHKMDPPRYQHLTKETFQWVDFGKNSKVKVIAGSIEGATKSPFTLTVPVLYADVNLGADSSVELPIDSSFETAIVYVYDGEGIVYNGPRDVTGTLVYRKDTVVYSSEPIANSVLKITSTSGVSVMVMAGKRIGEPVARYGPFVMNTQAELDQAVKDYQTGKLVREKGSMVSF